MEFPNEKEETIKIPNEIKLGFHTKTRNVLTYSNFLLKESNYRTIHLSAVGGAIGTLINVVEILKLEIAGLYQINKIATISYQTVDQKGNLLTQVLLPKFDVTLTFDEPKEIGIGYQGKYEENERLRLNKIENERRRIERYERQKRIEIENQQNSKFTNNTNYSSQNHRGQRQVRGNRPLRKFNRRGGF